MKTLSRFLAVVLCIALALSLCACGHSEEKKAYKSAMELLNAGEYDQAERAFAALGDFEDS